MEDNGLLAENKSLGGVGQGFFAVASGKTSSASVVASPVLQDAVARCLVVVVDDTALRLEMARRNSQYVEYHLWPVVAHEAAVGGCGETVCHGGMQRKGARR